MKLQDYKDEELVAKYQETREYPFLTELFTRHSDVIYRNALRKMKNPADAEDIVQMAYIKMVKDLLMFKGTGSIIGWMVQVVIHTSYDRLKSEKSRHNRDKKIMSERVQMTSPKNYELTEMIETHLNKLPEIYKLPITLQIMDGLTVKEVSDALEIPEKTIRSQIARGLEKLRASLQSVGVTASVISVGDLLREIQQPIAPDIIKSNQFFNTIYQNKASVSAKVAISSGAKSLVIPKILLFLFSALSLGALFTWFQMPKESSLTSPTKIYKKWDFENSKNLSDYQDIGLVSGKISIAEQGILNNSSYLKVADETLIALDISKYNLPIKISYQTKVELPRNGRATFGQILFKGNYLRDKKILQLFGLYEFTPPTHLDNSLDSKIGGTEELINVVAYVDENNIDFWWNDKRFYLFKGNSRDNKKLYLYIKGKAVIDDLKIESIDQNDMPKKVAIDKVMNTLVVQEGIEKITIEKEKLEFQESSNVNPYILVENAASLESKIGLNNTEIAPFFDEDNKVVWVKPRQKKNQKWDFENTNDLSLYQSMGYLKGGLSIAESKGLANSNGLNVEDETLIEIDISQFKLPLKVSFRLIKTIPSEEQGVGYGNEGLFKNNLINNQTIFHLIGLRESFKIEKLNNEKNSTVDVGVISHIAYLDEKSIDFWVNGKRGTYMQAVSDDNKKIYLAINKGVIDDLAVESISFDDLPDKSNCEKLISKIEIKKGINKYILDKSHVGFSKSSDANPSLIIENPKIFEYTSDVLRKVKLPYLNEDNKVAWVKPRQKLMQKYEFEKPSEMFNFKLIHGNIQYFESLGLEKSGCIELKADSLLEIDISEFQLPIKISYSFDCVIPKGLTSKGVVILKGNYQKDKSIFNFIRLQPAKNVDVKKIILRNDNGKFGFLGEWLSTEIFVSEESIDHWFHTGRAGLVYGSSSDNKKIYLQVLDKTVIDNLTIESIALEAVPDYSKFKEFADAIPFEKGAKNYFRLKTETPPLYLDKNSKAELGICDKETMEKSLGLFKNTP